MPIITPRLVLKPPEPGDGAVLNAAVIETYKKLREYMLWAEHKPTITESEEYVREAAANWILKKNDEPFLPLLIFDKNTMDFVGSTGFHHFDWDVPALEIGYWIRNKYTGRGLMTEAVNAQTQYAMKQLGMKRVVITCDEDNIASQKIPEQLGFTLEGKLINHRIKPISKEIGNTLLYAKYDLTGLPELKIT